jgi:hypothetical protein
LINFVEEHDALVSDVLLQALIVSGMEWALFTRTMPTSPPAVTTLESDTIRNANSATEKMPTTV